MNGLALPEAGTRLLVLAPHPDDETLGCAELMLAVAAAGGCIRIVLLTDGEMNSWPQRWTERRWRLDTVARRRWGQLRLAEMRAAMAKLGLADVVIQRLAWPDLGVTAQALDPQGRGWRRLATEIQAFKPTLVLCPDLSDRHPDHGSCHVLARLAMAAVPAAPARVLGYRLHGGPTGKGWRIPPEASRAVLKQAAVECYVSQLRLSGGRFRAWARQPETYLDPPRARLGPAGVVRLPWRPGWLARWADPVLSLVDCHGAQSWRWSQAPLARCADGYYHLQRPDRPWMEGPCYVRLAARHPGPWIFDHWGWVPADAHDMDVDTSI
ncbi:PIG-L deacetylase family protein [Frateuria aurantia]